MLAGRDSAKVSLAVAPPGVTNAFSTKKYELVPPTKCLGRSQSSGLLSSLGKLGAFLI